MYKSYQERIKKNKPVTIHSFTIYPSQIGIAATASSAWNGETVKLFVCNFICYFSWCCLLFAAIAFYWLNEQQISSRVISYTNFLSRCLCVQFHYLLLFPAVHVSKDFRISNIILCNESNTNFWTTQCLDSM